MENAIAFYLIFNLFMVGCVMPEGSLYDEDLAALAIKYSSAFKNV